MATASAVTRRLIKESLNSKFFSGGVPQGQLSRLLSNKYYPCFSELWVFPHWWLKMSPTRRWSAIMGWAVNARISFRIPNKRGNMGVRQSPINALQPLWPAVCWSVTFPVNTAGVCVVTHDWLALTHIYRNYCRQWCNNYDFCMILVFRFRTDSCSSPPFCPCGRSQTAVNYFKSCQKLINMFFSAAICIIYECNGCFPHCIRTKYIKTAFAEAG